MLVGEIRGDLKILIQTLLTKSLLGHPSTSIYSLQVIDLPIWGRLSLSLCNLYDLVRVPAVHHPYLPTLPIF